MGKIKSFLTGAAVGVGAALLLAPQTGEQTRTIIIEKANAVAGEAKDFSSNLPGAAQDLVKNAQEKARGIAGGEQAAPAPAADDDLREKIEAARQRIAAQVKANAEQSQAAMGEVKEAVAEAI